MIKNGKVVSLSYVLKNDSGEELDNAIKEDPFVYLHGSHQVIPGLETALEGLKSGDKKNVRITPEHAYGEIDPSLRVEVPRQRLPKNAQIEVGTRFRTETEEGQELVFVVQKIEGDSIHMDGNHPLAGETLHFDLEVLSVRDATEEEKQHGHAHSGSGHHHH